MDALKLLVGQKRNSIFINFLSKTSIDIINEAQLYTVDEILLDVLYYNILKNSFPELPLTNTMLALVIEVLLRNSEYIYELKVFLDFKNKSILQNVLSIHTNRYGSIVRNDICP
ncbi:hypothetical protein PXD56_04315 [Maribacter sp. SA7]|uniref:hypothetical protein n=1 Tax=Maribacter zhoushanensis TaxID=3030012 RepID=UPI0023EDDA42|nr:hypothetical protein [Maribacter zhoushanensis]MDF4202162.1 hypothetical protein [Maribacter zhoushanensis]